MRSVVAATAGWLFVAGCKPLPPPDPQRDDVRRPPEEVPGTLVSPEEAPHLVAFVRMEEKKLYVVKPDVLEKAITTGAWKTVRWRRGEADAMIDTTDLIVELIEQLDADRERPPAIGDVRLLDTFRRQVEHEESRSGCLRVGPDSDAPGAKTAIVTEPFYVTLEPEGDVLAPELYSQTLRWHSYRTAQCEELIGFHDYEATWIAKRGPFPGP